MILLALIALVVIPPEKLPEFARQVARIFSELRRSTSGVWDDLKQEAMLKPDDLLKYKSPTPPASPTSAETPAVTPVTSPIDLIMPNANSPEDKKPYE